MGEGKNMGRNSDPKSEIMKVRIRKSVREECTKVRTSGPRADEPESSFLGYMIELGIKRYEKQILPVERGDDLNCISEEKRRAAGS